MIGFYSLVIHYSQIVLKMMGRDRPKNPQNVRRKKEVEGGSHRLQAVENCIRDLEFVSRALYHFPLMLQVHHLHPNNIQAT